MSAPLIEAADLLDLKLLPAWLKESDAKNHYEHYTAEEDVSELRSRDGDGRHKDRKFGSRERQRHSQHARSKPDRRHRSGMPKPSDNRRHHSDRSKNRRSPDRDAAGCAAAVGDKHSFSAAPDCIGKCRCTDQVRVSCCIRFLPSRVCFWRNRGATKFVSQQKQKRRFINLGEAGAVSVDREFLERNAFRFAQRDFYQIDAVESDPIKGNFSNVARCRLSGTLLGPTNYHAYQPQLRSLYEQRFSRRMNFADYQRQIEIVSDSTLVERWKDEARKVTSYTTLREESPVTFSSVAETERHFRSNYFSGLIRSCEDVTIGGSLSRRLADRILNRAIEQAWVRETRSPSNMMQELVGRFRQNRLHIFRHRRGMLFVSPIRIRAFVHEHASVSSSVNAILETVLSAARINRKQLFEKLTGVGATEEAETRRLAFAADLRWLINEGYVIEFNDGSLDLPRTKSKQQEHRADDEATEGSSTGSFVGGMELALAAPRALAIYSPTILKDSL